MIFSHLTLFCQFSKFQISLIPCFISLSQNLMITFLIVNSKILLNEFKCSCFQHVNWLTIGIIKFFFYIMVENCQNLCLSFIYKTKMVLYYSSNLPFHFRIKGQKELWFLRHFESLLYVICKYMLLKLRNDSILTDIFLFSILHFFWKIITTL